MSLFFHNLFSWWNCRPFYFFNPVSGRCLQAILSQSLRLGLNLKQVLWLDLVWANEVCLMVGHRPGDTVWLLLRDVSHNRFNGQCWTVKYSDIGVLTFKSLLKVAFIQNTFWKIWSLLRPLEGLTLLRIVPSTLTERSWRERRDLSFSHVALELRLVHLVLGLSNEGGVESFI